MSKVAIFIAEGLEEIEGLTVVDLLRRAGITIDTVSISGSLKITGSHQICFEADYLFEAYDFDTVDMLVLPGGMPGTKYLLAHSGVNQKIKEFYVSGKALAAVCAAPSVLGQAGILDGKRATCYPGYEDKLLGADICYEEVVTDKTVITSRGLGTAIPFSLSIITYLCGKEMAEKIRDSIQYNH
ncbi:MAG: DJ-1 family glyoxalase III [Velocimicrobium sp.]